MTARHTNAKILTKKRQKKTIFDNFPWHDCRDLWRFNSCSRVSREKSGGYMKMNDILLPHNYIKFHLVKSINLVKLVIKTIQRQNINIFWRQTIEKSCSKFFSGTSRISYCSKTCSSSQSHQLPTDLDTYRRWKISLKKGGSRMLQKPS